MENLGLIIAIAGTGFTMVSVLFVVIFWTRGECNSLRAEANEDRNSLRADANADRRDMVNLMFAIKEEVQGIQLEMRDFHNRLCDIQSRKTQ